MCSNACKNRGFLSRFSDRRGGANNCANNWVIDFVVKRVGRSAISAPYIMRITRHGAPKASHASWTSGKKKGRRDNANNTKEGEDSIRGRGGSDVPLTVSSRTTLLKNNSQLFLGG